MRVLHININYSTRRLHQKLALALEKNGVDNIIFAPTYDTKQTVIYIRDNEVVSECFNKSDRYIFSLKQKKIYNSLLKNIDVRNIDIIHGHTLFSDGNVAYMLNKNFGIPYVVTIRNQDIYSFFKKLFFLRKKGVDILLSADAIICLSESYKKTLLDKYVPKKYIREISSKIQIIPNGIDDFWFENKFNKAKNLNDEKNIRLLYVGEITQNKNITTTQKAMDILKEKGISCKLSIVGPVRDKEYFNKIIDNEHTTYHNRVPKEELIDFYRDHDIFIMPSIHETFGLVYAEAMSQGLPIIYSKNQGFDGQFEDGEVGFAVDSLDYNQVSYRIKDIIDDYDRISENCLRSFEKFDWRKISNEYKGIYESIIEKASENLDERIEIKNR